MATVQTQGLSISFEAAGAPLGVEELLDEAEADREPVGDLGLCPLFAQHCIENALTQVC